MKHAHRSAPVRLVVVLLAAGLALVGCGGGSSSTSATTSSQPTTTVGQSSTTASAGGLLIDPGDNGNYTANLNPADFVAGISNPWLPLTPGAKWTYRVEESGNVTVVETTVTSDTKVILGITATVVHDQLTSNGAVIEDTYDWYAQDRAGNVWYLGEDTEEFVDGQVVSTEGSWEAGVDGAQAGIWMEADPQVGDIYRQEFYKGHAEDAEQIMAIGETQVVPAGTYQDLLVINDWTPLEADVLTTKYIARGVGVVLEVNTQGPPSRTELVSFQPGA
jgi:hypothetical protein